MHAETYSSCSSFIAVLEATPLSSVTNEHDLLQGEKHRDHTKAEQVFKTVSHFRETNHLFFYTIVR